jgi:hypothetical protein
MSMGGRLNYGLMDSAACQSLRLTTDTGACRTPIEPPLIGKEV